MMDDKDGDEGGSGSSKSSGSSGSTIREPLPKTYPGTMSEHSKGGGQGGNGGGFKGGHGKSMPRSR